MLSQGVIKESSSPWMTPKGFVPKKVGELWICIDYCSVGGGRRQQQQQQYSIKLVTHVQLKTSLISKMS